MPEPVIQSVADTAFMIAHHRAVESARADALFRDPFAHKLAGDHGRRAADSMSTRDMTGWMVAIRTHIIDDFVAEAVRDGFDVVLNLGAGLDTRPYRLELPQTLRWIEVDYPHVLAHKQDALAADEPRCRLERTPVDLADAAARRAFLDQVNAGAERILVITEGVIPYLEVAEVGALADDLTGASAVRRWVVDYISPASLTYRRRRGLDKDLAKAPFKFMPPDWFGFFADHGWKPRQVRYLDEEGQRLGRRPPLPLALRALIRLGGLLRRGRAGGFNRFAGYALLERADAG